MNFDFRLVQPQGKLSTFVQGIWSATVSVNQQRAVVKPLYSDAGSGIMFNLAGNITIDDVCLPKGVVIQSVSKHAQKISMPAGTKIAGVRFHPAVGYSLLGQRYQTPMPLSLDVRHYEDLRQLFDALSLQKNHDGAIELLSSWVQQLIQISSPLPQTIQGALQGINDGHAGAELADYAHLSQRQVERMFNRWLGMSPKHCQRILRVRKAIAWIKRHQNDSLADVAARFGFSDQAHMTREFRSIAQTTPNNMTKKRSR